MYATMEVLKNEDCKVQCRQLAGIIFKNTLLNNHNGEECADLWKVMSTEQRDMLKENSLIALLNEDKSIIRAAATALSAI